MNNDCINDNEVTSNKSNKISIRINDSLLDYIDFCCDKCGFTRSEFIRSVLEGKSERLMEYCKQVKFINEQQGIEIKKEAIKLVNAVSEYSKQLQIITKEINRIGVNYNQQVRLLHEEVNDEFIDHISVPDPQADELQKLINNATKISSECNNSFNELGEALQWLL